MRPASSEPTLRRIAARSASFTFLAYGLTQALTLGTYVVLARLTVPEVFGVFGAATILLATGEVFVESGMTAAVVQRRRDVEEAASTAFVATLAGGILLTLAALAGSVLVGLYFDSRQVGVVAAALSGTVAVNTLCVVPLALLQRRFSPLRYVVVEPAAALAFGIGAGLGLAYGLEVWGLVVGAYCWSVVRAGALWLCARWRPRPRQASWRMWRELAGYGRWVVASESLREVTRIATTALVGRFLGTKSLGEFRFGWRLVNQAGGPLLSANAHVLLPAVAAADNEEDVQRRSLLSLRLVTFAAFPLSALFVALGEPIALLLFGDDWAGVGPVLAGLALLPAAQAIDSVASEIWKARARPDYLPRMHGLGAALSVGLVAVFVAADADAAGVGVALSLSALAIATYALVRLATVIGIGVGQVARPLAPAFASALFAAAAAWLADAALGVDSPILRVTVGSLVGLGAYLLALSVVSRGMLRDVAATAREFRRSSR
jgi:PST family polysaccharide transporter